MEDKWYACWFCEDVVHIVDSDSWEVTQTKHGTIGVCPMCSINEGLRDRFDLGLTIPCWMWLGYGNGPNGDGWMKLRRGGTNYYSLQGEPLNDPSIRTTDERPKGH